jgi:hypothetical protein
MSHAFAQVHAQPQPHVRLLDELGACRRTVARRGAQPRAAQRRMRVRAGAAAEEAGGDALVAEDLSVRLGAGSERVQALRQATLRVKRGTLHMLLGPNGCGKVRSAHCTMPRRGADAASPPCSRRCCAFAAACCAPRAGVSGSLRRARLCSRTRTTRWSCRPQEPTSPLGWAAWGCRPARSPRASKPRSRQWACRRERSRAARALRC